MSLEFAPEMSRKADSIDAPPGTTNNEHLHAHHETGKELQEATTLPGRTGSGAVARRAHHQRKG